MSDQFDPRAYADKHGYVKFEAVSPDTDFSCSDYRITVSGNGKQSMSIGLTTKQTKTLLAAMKSCMEPEHE